MERLGGELRIIAGDGHRFRRLDDYCAEVSFTGVRQTFSKLDMTNMGFVLSSEDSEFEYYCFEASDYRIFCLEKESQHITSFFSKCSYSGSQRIPTSADEPYHIFDIKHSEGKRFSCFIVTISNDGRPHVFRVSSGDSVHAKGEIQRLDDGALFSEKPLERAPQAASTRDEFMVPEDCTLLQFIEESKLSDGRLLSSALGEGECTDEIEVLVNQFFNLLPLDEEGSYLGAEPSKEAKKQIIRRYQLKLHPDKGTAGAGAFIFLTKAAEVLKGEQRAVKRIYDCYVGVAYSFKGFHLAKNIFPTAEGRESKHNDSSSCDISFTFINPNNIHDTKVYIVPMCLLFYLDNMGEDRIHNLEDFPHNWQPTDDFLGRLAASKLPFIQKAFVEFSARFQRHASVTWMGYLRKDERGKIIDYWDYAEKCGHTTNLPVTFGGTDESLLMLIKLVIKKSLLSAFDANASARAALCGAGVIEGQRLDNGKDCLNADEDTSVAIPAPKTPSLMRRYLQSLSQGPMITLSRGWSQNAERQPFFIFKKRGSQSVAYLDFTDVRPWPAPQSLAAFARGLGLKVEMIKGGYKTKRAKIARFYGDNIEAQLGTLNARKVVVNVDEPVFLTDKQKLQLATASMLELDYNPESGVLTIDNISSGCDGTKVRDIIGKAIGKFTGASYASGGTRNKFVFSNFKPLELAKQFYDAIKGQLMHELCVSNPQKMYWFISEDRLSFEPPDEPVMITESVSGEAEEDKGEEGFGARRNEQSGGDTEQKQALVVAPQKTLAALKVTPPPTVQLTIRALKRELEEDYPRHSFAQWCWYDRSRPFFVFTREGDMPTSAYLDISNLRGYEKPSSFLVKKLAKKMGLSTNWNGWGALIEFKGDQLNANFEKFQVYQVRVNLDRDLTEAEMLKINTGTNIEINYDPIQKKLSITNAELFWTPILKYGNAAKKSLQRRVGIDEIYFMTTNSSGFFEYSGFHPDEVGEPPEKLAELFYQQFLVESQSCFGQEAERKSHLRSQYNRLLGEVSEDVNPASSCAAGAGAGAGAGARARGADSGRHSHPPGLFNERPPKRRARSVANPSLSGGGGAGAGAETEGITNVIRKNVVGFCAFL
jgi:hypothetical protein